VLEHAIDSEVVLPADIIQAISARVLTPPAGLLRDDDVQVLSLLAGGATQADIAAGMGYARRTIQRRLADLYDRIGAANLDGARRLAIAWGLGDTGRDAGSDQLTEVVDD
jgi:DNA-binding NarL/FixJ family response regulator